MIALWLLLMIAVWSGLTWLLWKLGRTFIGGDHPHRQTRRAIAAVIATIWLCASFWYAGGRIIYYDTKVDRLCEIDGGVKVYERVTLPAAEFDRLARQNWILPEASEAKESDSYFRTRQTWYFRESDPQVVKIMSRYIRRSDGKVVGEYIHYGRGGGDLPGPWHGSSYSCPNPVKLPNVEQQIFLRGGV